MSSGGKVERCAGTEIAGWSEGQVAIRNPTSKSSMTHDRRVLQRVKVRGAEVFSSLSRSNPKLLKISRSNRKWRANRRSSLSSVLVAGSSSFLPLRRL